MESGKGSETLELNQFEILCSEVREDGSLGCLSNSTALSSVDCLSNSNELSGGELVRKLGNGGVEESMVDGIAGNNRMNEGFVSSYPDKNMSILHNISFPVFLKKCSGNDGDQTAKAEGSVGKFDDGLHCGRMNEGFVNGYPDEKLSVSMHNIDFPVFKGELKCGGNDGGQTAKVEESVGKFDYNLHCDELLHDVKIDMPMEESDDVFHPHEPGSPTKIEVSGSSINLFVEVFGPLDGISDDGLECKLGENGFKQESSLEENGTLSTGVTDVIDKQECTFDIGDLVWIKTRNQLWWPGMVSDPSTAPDGTAKCERKDSYLVKFYGSANYVWCDDIYLKPFVQYFDQMSGQNDSRNFCGSVERAICEIGLRVQLKMTCPCFSKDSQTLDARWRNKGENCMSMEKDVLSLSQFQPARFIADIRDLARSIHAPSKVELMVMKNRLSPFYRSIGHFELPLQLIRSGSDAAQITPEHVKSGVRDQNSVEGHDGNLTRSMRKRKTNVGHVLDDHSASSAKAVESRERKKSRYLTYPYVDVIKGKEKEDPKQSSSVEGSYSGVDSRKRGSYKKPVKECHVISKADDISACSAELLAELCSSARDCSYVSRSKYSDSLKRFYGSFRMFSFPDAAEIAAKAASEAEEKKRSKKQRTNLASAKESVEKNVVGDKSSIAGDQKSKENVVKRKYRKKNKEQVTNAEKQTEGIRVGKESDNHEVYPKLPKENGIYMETNNEKEKVIPAGFESVQNSFGIGTNVYPKSSWMISFQQACSTLFKSNKSPQKSVGVTPTPGLVETNSTPRLPDLNGKHPVSPVDHMPAEGPPTNLVSPLPEQRKPEGLVFLSPTVNIVHQMDPASVSSSKPTFQSTPVSNNGVAVPYQCVNGDVAARAVDPVTGLSPIVKHPLQMGDILSAYKPVNGDVAARAVDPVTGLSPIVKHPLQMRDILSAYKPVAKKRKRKENFCQVASGIPDLNGNVLETSPLGTTTPEGSHIPPPEGETQRKRRSKFESGESCGGNVVLNFAAGTVPAKEYLVATFSRFGLLKESELEVLSDDSVKIVYERSSDARFAFRSLEKSHAFGESLLNFKLDGCMPDPPPKIKKKNNFPLQTFVPASVAAGKNQTKGGETPPDMAFIKQKVEMMKSTLEKAGDRLSPEIRAKLENEIKAFLDKISSVTPPGFAL